MNARSMTGDDYQTTTYCKKWIPSTSNIIATWKFKINNICKYSQIIVGITCNDDCQNSDFTEKNKTATYALESNGDWSIANGISSLEKFDGREFTVDDEITFILNLSERKINFQVNAGQEFQVWTNIKVSDNIKYKFAINLEEEDCEIALIDFSINSVSI